MSTRAARRRKAHKLSQGLASRAYVLTLPAQSSAAPPDFGPEKPPDADRSVRVVKDVLRVGKWKTGYDAKGAPVFWDVTPAVLTQIVADFNAMKANGVGANLGKTHGDENLSIHPDDLIAPVDELKVAGDTLWMSSYVTPDEAKYLRNDARKVSVGVIPNHEDGAGRKYRLYLTHVAVTDRPVVAGQHPFLAMALADGAGGGSMNPELLDAINVLMEAAGLGKLGDVADEAALIEQLKGVAAALGKDTGSKPEGDGGAPPPASEGAAMDIPLPGVPAPMADSIRKALGTVMKARDEQIKALTDELANREKAAQDAAKTAFTAKVAELTKSGVEKRVLDDKIALANSLKSFDLRLLDGLAPTLSRGGAARSLADPKHPDDAGKSVEDRRNEIAKDIAARRGIALADALKLVP